MLFMGGLAWWDHATTQARERERREEGLAAARQAADREREQVRLAAEQRRREAVAFEIEMQKGRNTIAYLDSFQSTGRGAADRTDAQRKASWDATFGAQWVRWEGTVVEVSGRGSTCDVSMRCGSQTLTSDTRFELDRATAVSLSKGQRVRVEGRLHDHDAFGYTLVDVRVLATW